MITVTAMKWAPPFAAGNVRDHRLRWVLNEVGWAYEVRLVDAPTLKSDDHARAQPFGQVPSLTEDGRPPLFESGAIVLDIATRAGKLLPEDAGVRALAVSWLFAAVASVEPFLQNVAEVEFFLKDEADKARRRPVVMAAATDRLERLAAALGDRAWLVGEAFTVADLMMASVLKIARGLGLLEGFPTLLAYQDRCLARPAYRRAEADQRAEIAAHGPRDMRYDAVPGR